DCTGSTPVYYAWYEMYPAFPVNLTMSILPGDKITATVTNSGSTFTMNISNGRGGSYTTPPLKLKRADLSSAEWVAEAPSGRGGVLPLANFGTVNFSGSYTLGNGVQGEIADSHWQNDPMTMETTAGVVKATPSGLTSSKPSSFGSLFSVTWSHQ